MKDSCTQKTIDDFGQQWTRYQKNNGYYASLENLVEILGPILSVDQIEGKSVADIGSGSGRIVGMLLAAGAKKVTAVEPSSAMDVLKENLADEIEKGMVVCVQGRGESIPEDGQFEYVFSLGVLHHIPSPDPVVASTLKALKPGGKFIVWLYGKEGNGLYLFFVSLMRALTTKMPHWLLAFICWCLYVPLVSYGWMCRVLPLPLHKYFTKHLMKMSRQDRYLHIYDQLNPEYAKYYRQDEAIALLERNGFTDVKTYHKMGYSWTVIGTK